MSFLVRVVVNADLEFKKPNGSTYSQLNPYGRYYDVIKVVAKDPEQKYVDVILKNGDKLENIEAQYIDLIGESKITPYEEPYERPKRTKRAKDIEPDIERGTVQPE